MMDIDLNYNIIDEIDDTDENFMSEVPLSIIENSIENQLNDPLEYRKKDYINDFIVKYNYMRENEFDNYAQTVDEFHDEFMDFITKIYDEKLNLGFPDIENKSDEEQHELIHTVYLFFIRKIKKNFVTIICNEIDDNKSVFAAEFDHRKDITYNTFKEEIGDDEYASIISNLGNIITKILNKIYKEYDVDKFFEMCDYGEASVDRDAIIQYFDNFDITGNFIPNYVDIVANNEFFIIDLETKVRSHILKNFPMRKIDIEKIDNKNNLDDNN